MSEFLPHANSAISQPDSVEAYNSPIDRNADENANDLKENSIVLDGRESNHTPHLQDIHGNYAKRRYKNVESKVGRYIASIRAEERKRRAAKIAFRSNSAPTFYSAPIALATDEPETEDQQQKVYSTNDLYKLHESTSEVDTEVMTSSAYSSSTHGGGASLSGVVSRHESSDDAVNGTDFIDKETYAQIVREKEHLETLLDEKRSECFRHRRNVDFLRLELTNCQDELKRAKQISKQSHLRYSSSGFGGYSFRSGYPSLEQLSNAPIGFETKATQTDLVLTVEGFGTPKRRSTNDSILRRRTNSFSQKVDQRRNYDYDYSDEMDVIYKAKGRKLQTAAGTPPASPALSSKNMPTHAEYTYYDRAKPYAPVPTKNVSADSETIELNTQKTKEQHELYVTKCIENRRQARRITFRQRLNRLFGRCTRCDDPNQSLDAYGQTYTENEMEMQSPTPLLARTEANVNT